MHQNQNNIATPKIAPKVWIASLSGSVIEWFDFLLYGTVAALVFNRLYFPTDDAFVSTVISFASFSLVFFFRPLGGIIFAHFGDRIGRKKTLLITLLLMGGGTVAIGLLPDFYAIGIWAPILLILFRILQGIGLGGEWGGAMLLVFEYAPPKRRGLYGSIPMIGIGLGMLLASGVVSLLTLMPEEQFLLWGWRIPFVGSIVLILIALFIRRAIDETPVFKKIKESGKVHKMPLKEAFAKHWKEILVSICIKAPETSGFYIFGVYIIAYAVNFLGIQNNYTLAAVAVGALVSTIIGPIVGAISDRISRIRLYKIITIFYLLLIFPYYWIINTGSVGAVFVATVIGFGLLWGSINAILGTLMAENFPPSIRYTGASLGYQFSAAIFGGTAPLISVYLMKVSGNQWWTLAVFVICLTVLGLLASFALPKFLKNSANDYVEHVDNNA